MPIKRHKRRLKDGTDRTYTYAVSEDGTTESLSIANSKDSPQLYRSKEFKRIVAALVANSSLLVVGESGAGKSFLADAIVSELSEMNFTVAVTNPGTVKQILLDLAAQLAVDTESLEGKALSSLGLMKEIADWLKTNTAFLICDDAHRFPVSLRCWLEQLNKQEQPMLLLATFPPARDIFLKLPRIELEPMSDRAIRAIMSEAAAELSLELNPAQLASLQERTGGNPMLARRVVREEYLGLDGNALDHTQWIDGTPFLIAALMCFVIIRFIGLGFNSTSLYLIGGMITVAIGVVRIMLYSLPRKSGKLGQ
jgi:AAA domain